MNILLITTPIRVRPTNFPPIGALSLLKAARKNGFPSTQFYHVDGNRPDYGAVLEHLEKVRPDVVGISAVVSTAYAYTKRLCGDIKRLLPDTLVVVGGNLAASAEILLRKAGADLCCIGEGERVFVNVLRRAETTHRPADFLDIPGLALLDGNGRLRTTSFEAPLGRDEIYDYDIADLVAACDDIETYINPLFIDDECQSSEFKFDQMAWQPHRRNKKLAIIPGAKGCVARCTFCHRFDKGIRYIPVDRIMRQIEILVRDHDVGFISFGDENFGTDKRWLAELCARLKPLDLLWRVGGMRVNCVSPEIIAMMQDAGCRFIAYGMETGSPRMLEVMEKKTTIEDNRNAIRWTIEAGIAAPIQIVLGMPGETSETVQETIEFCKHGQTFRPEQNPNDLSINYAQALPGTPLYEFARSRGHIPLDLDGEERYLLSISDHDAHDEVTTLNLTDYPALICQSWRPRMTVEVNYAYVAKFGLEHYHKVLLNDANYFKKKRRDDGYFANPKRLVDTSMTVDSMHGSRDAMEVEDENTLPSLWGLLRQGNLGLAMICYPILFYRLRRLIPLMILAKNAKRVGLDCAVRQLAETMRWLLRRNWRGGPFTYKSLRKIVKDDIGPIPGDRDGMDVLRQGR
ncbi:B12-binding domain-containing radical SAM protein [Paramagnetospirillum magneticum]|nr:radical SAM protein [Paramagnetospirillum magneticum]